MALTPIAGFCGGSWAARSRGISAQRTVNMRVERNQEAIGSIYTSSPVAKGPTALYARSGKKLFSNALAAIDPTAKHNGAWSSKFSVFFVAGTAAYELFQDRTITKLGDVQLATNPATFRANGTQLMIVVGGKVYVATGTKFFQPIVNFASGTVNITGTMVTRVDGDPFIDAGSPQNDIAPGDMFMLVGDLFTVDTVTDADNLTLTASAGAITGIRYEAGREMLTGATCECIDEYGIVNTPNTKNFRLSNLADFTKWDEIDEGSKSGSTDNISVVMNVGGNLGLFGDTNSTEIWGDSGNSDFPFERIGGNSISIGIDAPWSLQKLADGSLVGLMYSDAGDGQIVRSNGGEPVRISDHALENAMRTYGRINDAIGSTYLENGHSYYRIDFPTPKKTWEFDVTSGAWVELGIATAQEDSFDADLGRFHVHVTWPNQTRMHLLFDYTSGKIWEMSPDFLDDDGVDFPVMRIGPHYNSNFKRIHTKQFALDCEMGTIDPTARGADGKALIPTVNLSYSDDGGYNWTEAGAASLGRVGEYSGTELTAAESFDTTPSSQTNPQVFEPMPVWNRLGSDFIARTFKVKSTGKQLRSIYNGLVDIE